MITEFQTQYPLLFNLGIFAIVLLITWVIEHVVFKLVKGLGVKAGNPLPSSTIFANIARVCIWLAGIALGAKVAFGYDLTGLVAALGIGGIALSLGMQDTLQNLIGGLQVSLGRLVEPGEYIEVLGQRGQVKDVTWRHTTMIDTAGKTHIIPNSVINRNEIIDLGTSGDVLVPFLSPLGTDLNVMTEQMKASIEREFEGAIGNRGVRIQIGGTEYGGISCRAVADIMRSEGSESAIADRIARAIDPYLSTDMPE